MNAKHGDINIPKLFSSGIVTRPTLALIGEAGPEAVVPLNRSGATGTVINLTINAGIGTDPNTLGRTVIEAIKRYERTNGPVFASA